LWLRNFYGERPPIVRCLHHWGEDGPIALNLTLEGRVYPGGTVWERDAETVAEFARRAANDLATDTVKFEQTWKLSGISSTTEGWGIAGRSEVAVRPITELARVLRRKADLLKDPDDADRIAARLFLHVRDYPAAETAARGLLKRPGHAAEQEGRQILAESLSGRGLFREAGVVYRSMLLKDPKSKNIRASLAETLDAEGRNAEARKLMEAIDPGRILVEHMAPGFSVPLLGGQETSITESLRGKKALLVNFWFIRCGPCREELPKLQKLYDDLKGKGLEVVAVNTDDEETAISRYVKTSGWTFPIALGSKQRQGKSMPELYFVELFPTNFLIDATGMVVYRRVGWDDVAIRAALRKLGVE
jgi:thiol-disulfide isomerase/thioredoxin